MNEKLKDFANGLLNPLFLCWAATIYLMYELVKSGIEPILTVAFLLSLLNTFAIFYTGWVFSLRNENVYETRSKTKK